MATAELTMKQKSDAQKDIVQAIAVKRVVKHFKSSDRGQIAMFCGTGKTRTAIKAIKRLKSRVVVVCVPTLGLASQWINDFAEHGEDREVLAVCSRMNSELPEDYGIIGYTTDKSIVRDFARRKGKLLIVSTYQSYDVVQEAWKRTKIAPIDLLIADEAHNTAGKNSKHMGLCLHDRGAKVSKRLFMTATRRLYRGDKDEYNCMDDTAVYGDVVYELPLREAIDRGIVSDYEVYVINVYKDLRPEDFENINRLGFESDMLAKFVANKIMSDKTVRVFTFHNRVDDATEFAQQVESHGKWARVITGDQKVKDRESTLREFESHENSSLTASVNTLGEGIDVPSVDVIVFADKMTEPQAIIQRMGRGTRIVAGKKKLRILIPVCVSPEMSDDDVNQVADESMHKDALNVIRALASYDPKFYRQVANIESNLRNESNGDKKGSSKSQDKMVQFDGVNPKLFRARLIPKRVWPSLQSVLPEIERSIVRYYDAFRKKPAYRSGVVMCPVGFDNWRSVYDFLRYSGGESLTDVAERLTGMQRRKQVITQNRNRKSMSDVNDAFSVFIQTNNRPPRPVDGCYMVPDNFDSWKQVGKFLSGKGSSLSKLSAEYGYFSRGCCNQSISDIIVMAKNSLMEHYDKFGKLPKYSDAFILGRSFGWFVDRYRDDYDKMRASIGVSRFRSKESIVNSIKAFYNRTGASPRAIDLPREYDCCKRRGCKWEDLVIDAGIAPSASARAVSKLSSVVDYVQKFVRKRGKKPTVFDCNLFSQFVRRNKPFGISSWPKFVDHVLAMEESK